MKTLAVLLTTTMLLAAALLVSSERVSEEPRVRWEEDLAIVEWAEPLADPSARPDEVRFSLLSGPYIGWLTPRSATIGWEVIAEKSLSVSPYASLPVTYPADKIRFRSVTLTGLQPDREYRYRLQAGPYRGRSIAFRTLPDEQSTGLRFAMIGDTQRGEVPESAEIERKLFAAIHAWNPSVLVHLGDMLNTGRGNGLAGRKSWFRTFERNRTLRGSVFMAPTAGNHCLLGSGHGWYADYFNDVKLGHARGRQEDAARPPFYYSFDIANVHFVSLCTESPKFAGKQDVSNVRHKDLPFTYNEQLAWFENDLKNARAPWKVIFFHQPLHTGGPHPAPEHFRKDFGAVCDRHGVQLVLSGHDHSYQKTQRITNVSRMLSDTGSVQVISGGGDIKQFDRVKNPPAWNVMHRKINHYVRVEVGPVDMRFDAVDVDGNIFDAWRLPLRGQPEPLPLQKENGS